MESFLFLFSFEEFCHLMATVRSVSYMEIRDQTDHAENIMRGGYLKQ